MCDADEMRSGCVLNMIELRFVGGVWFGAREQRIGQTNRMDGRVDGIVKDVCDGTK